MENLIHELNEPGESIDMEHVADSALEEIQPGMIVQGEIVTVDSDFAYVNVGTKSDGRIQIQEFDTQPQVGEKVHVLLNSKRLVDGMYQFSMKAAEAEKRWHEFMESYRNGSELIQGVVKSVINKGKLIDSKGLTAFLPFSLAADLRNAGPSDIEYEFKVKSIDEKKRSLILSRKDYLDEEYIKRWDLFTENYKVGDRITGEVIKFVEFGAFVRIEGIDALLHRNDMSWKKVFKQRKILKINEEREFVILDINREGGKISLGLKQLTEDPWLSIDGKYSVGDTVSGQVVTITGYGAFIEVDDGVEGFVNNADLLWSKNNVNVREVLEKGRNYDFMILGINREEKKLSLGYKQLQDNPWKTIKDRFPVDTILTRPVKKIVKFGMFVELEEGIDGLIHISDVSWDDNIRNLNDIYNIGDEVEFKILDILDDEMKISCGMKQLTRSPWEIIREKYPPRTRVEGVISGITSFGVFVKIDDDAEGLVHISEVSKRRVEDLEEYFQVGERVNAVVLDVNVEKKRLSLSIKHYEMQTEKEELDKIMKSTSPKTVTIGDMVNIKLGE